MEPKWKQHVQRIQTQSEVGRTKTNKRANPTNTIPTSNKSQQTTTNPNMANPKLAQDSQTSHSGKRNDINDLASHANVHSDYGRLRRSAEHALEKLVLSETTPAATRAAAARTLLELVGAIGPRKGEEYQEDGETDDPETLSAADIDERIKALSKKVDEV